MSASGSAPSVVDLARLEGWIEASLGLADPPPGADGTEPVPCGADLSAPAQDNFASTGERLKGADEGRRGTICLRPGCGNLVVRRDRKFCCRACFKAATPPLNPTMVCLNPGCTRPVKRPDRKFCSRDCAIAAGEKPRKCEVCGNRLSAAQNGQLTCSRICAADLPIDRRSVRDDKFREHVRRAWCEEGKTDTEIGRELRVTKNVIVGVRRRMKLPKRPTTRWPPGYVPKEQRPTGPPRKRPPPIRVGKRSTGPKAETNHGTSAVRSRIANAKVREASPIRVRQLPGDGCQYPVSENPWRICDDPRVSPPDRCALSPYCAEHYALCFNTVPTRRSSEEYLARVAA